MKSLVFSLLSLAAALFCSASAQSRIRRDDIRTLRTEIKGQLETQPSIRLGSTDAVEISFDQMSHEGRTFYYRVEHCDRSFNEPTSGLFRNEYLEASYEDIPIEEHRESQNTSVLYTHYTFRFPSNEARPLISGNYRISIFEHDDDSEQAVAEVAVYVVESGSDVTGRLTADTDEDHYAQKQQVELQTKVNERLPLTDLRLSLHASVFQNGREDNARLLLPPNVIISGRTARWEHFRPLIFNAGNVYRSFELLSTRVPGMNVESVKWNAPYYHATLRTDEVRRNYIVREDRNGTAVIRTTDNLDNSTESDYVWVHFTLDCDEMKDADVYVNGRWATGGLISEYRMIYRPERHAYEASLFLKQGYYNYMYLTVPRQGTAMAHDHLRGATAPTEGDFYQTRNVYSTFIYATAPGGRYDRLIGAARLRN